MKKEIDNIQFALIYFRREINGNCERIRRVMDSEKRFNIGMKGDIFEEIEDMEENEKIGFYLAIGDSYYSRVLRNYIPMNDKTYKYKLDRIAKDGSNWLTVKEIRDIVTDLKYEEPAKYYVKDVDKDGVRIKVIVYDSEGNILNVIM